MSLTGAHIPVIATERLVLRPPRPSDLEPFAATMTPDRMAYLHDAAPDRAGAARILTIFAGMAVLRGFGPMIWDHQGQPIGHGGIFWPLGADAPELGWVIWRSADEGHGYATEAMQALIRDAEAKTDLSDLWAGIHPGNARSHALATRLGLMRSTDTRPDGDMIYRRAV